MYLKSAHPQSMPLRRHPIQQHTLFIPPRPRMRRRQHRPSGHILITVAAIAREGEFSAITPCANPTRTANPNTTKPQTASSAKPQTEK